MENAVRYGVTGNPLVDGILSPAQQAELDVSQLRCAEAIRAYWATQGYGQPYPLAIKPTGYGKGRVIDYLLHPDEADGGKTLLIVGAKNILVEQNTRALRSLVYEATGQSRFSIMPDTSGEVIVATWQSLEAYGRKEDAPARIGLCLIDEAHNLGTILRLELLAWLNPKKVAAFTATAHRSSGTFREPETYGLQVLQEVTGTLPAYTEKGWLSPLIGIAIDTGIRLPRDILLAEGAVNQRELRRELRKHPDLFTAIGREIGTRFLPYGLKTLTIVNRIATEACDIYRQIESMGFKVGLAVNRQAATRLSGNFLTRDTIQRYQLPSSDPDAIQVLISPEVITEGFDDPATECIAWAAPTNSSRRYTQVTGRGARRCPGKAFCFVADFVYLIERYGYSLNFAQFFQESELRHLPGGLAYMGPEPNRPLNIPASVFEGARIVSIQELGPVPSANGWLTLNQLRNAVKAKSNDRVRTALRALNIQGERRRTKNEKVILHYSPETKDAIVKELAKIPEATADWIALDTLAKRVGETSTTHILSILIDHGVKPQKRRGTNGKSTDYYPASSIALVQRQLEAERSEKTASWLTLCQLSSKTGKSDALLLRCLKKRGIKSVRRQAGNGKITFHYPPDTLKRIAADIGEHVQEGWKAIEEACASINRDYRTGRVRMKQLGHAGKLMYDPQGKGAAKRSKLHYPPEAIAEMIQSLDAPEAQGWLHLKAVADAVGIWSEQALKKIKQLGIKGEIRLDKANRNTVHYPPDTAERILKLMGKA